MNQRLVNEVAVLAAKAALGVVHSALHPCVHRDALEEFHRIINAAIETYAMKVESMERRLEPSKN